MANVFYSSRFNDRRHETVTGVKEREIVPLLWGDLGNSFPRSFDFLKKC